MSYVCVYVCVLCLPFTENGMLKPPHANPDSRHRCTQCFPSYRTDQKSNHPLDHREMVKGLPTGPHSKRHQQMIKDSTLTTLLETRLSRH